MADDADAAVALAQRVEDVENLVERLLVEAAEALVDEERVEPYASRLLRDDVGEAEGEGEEAKKVSPPESVAVSRSFPVQASTTCRPRPARLPPERASEWTRV